MKGQIEVLGTNEGLSEFEGYSGEGSLISFDKGHHYLTLGEDKLTYQIYTTIHAENHIEYEGWGASESKNVGRMGIKYTPKDA